MQVPLPQIIILHSQDVSTAHSEYSRCSGLAWISGRRAIERGSSHLHPALIRQRVIDRHADLGDVVANPFVFAFEQMTAEHG